MNTKKNKMIPLYIYIAVEKTEHYRSNLLRPWIQLKYRPSQFVAEQRKSWWKITLLFFKHGRKK
jgi:hypothetical protein